MSWNDVVSIVVRLIAVVVLVFLNGFFVAAEFALVKVRDTQLRVLIERGNRRAKVANFILQRLDSFLSATQLGITLASLGLGWIGEPVFMALLKPVFDGLHVASEEERHAVAFVVGFTVITFLHISAGEQAPKWLAIQKPLPATLWVAYPMLWFYRVSYPFVVALNRTSQWLLRQVGVESATEMERAHSEEELRLLVSAAQKKSGQSALGRDIVLNALDLRRRVAREVMRPRQEIVSLSTESSIPECLEIADKTRYSRFPLCENGELDKTVGVVHIKDLYGMRLKARSGADLTPVARKLVYIPETARLEKLLQLLLERRLHMAVVVDEYGGTTGIVTLENILEELVGQIQDEFDQEKPLLAKTGENSWDAAGTLPLHELAELLGEPLGDEGVTTASGWITQRLGGFPKIGDKVIMDKAEVRVDEMDGRRVGKLKVIKK
ncbi:MAG TPA: hemolysin family protein [Candidatus Dormibacteraeota bacterium]|nr:hemolysin family protein [Candidatus Dormibacteraeota bacterium]